MEDRCSHLCCQVSFTNFQGFTIHSADALYASSTCDIATTFLKPLLYTCMKASHFDFAVVES